jgi:superfamily II DNA or RNA helicase
MPLVFLPDAEVLVWWGESPPRELEPSLQAPARWNARVLTPEGTRDVEGAALAATLPEAVATLARLPAADLDALPASVGTWALGSKLALSLVARERVVPTLARRGEALQARWAAALSASEDSDAARQIAEHMSPAAHAVALGDAEVWAASALLRAFLDAVVDALVRASRGGPELFKAGASKERAKPEKRAANAGGWDARFREALTGARPEFEAQGFGERSVASDVARWSEPALGARDKLRGCFRLELPETERDAFLLRFLLQAPDDASLLLDASEVWNGASTGKETGKARRAPAGRLLKAFRNPQEALLEALGRAARSFAPIARALEEAKPEQVALEPAEAWSFLSEGAELLAEAGFGVMVPGELTRRGQRRLRLRMRVGAKSKVAGMVKGAAGLGMDELLAVDWQAVIGDQALSLRELSALAKHKAPLVRYRGAWVALDPRELLQIQARIAGGPTHLSLGDALQAALAGEVETDGLPTSVVATGGFEDVLQRLQTSAAEPAPAPRDLRATLRPYQARGLHWLSTMSALGLGACLADDMGLGKTVQLIAHLLQRREQAGADDAPSLLVAPTSVLGNWERELSRFAPSLPIVSHYGATRAREAGAFLPGALVLTSYGLLRRDAGLLGQARWSVLALDEAQNIKNSASATARAARALTARQRFALTGTPVENRLAELWSIFELLNPGLLGPLPEFRKTFAVPIERYANEEAAARLKRVVGPFILRRLKSDPAVVSDLPAKHEMTVFCTLTREQATLYKAVVDEELRRIATSEGIERRGRVLALLTFAKQICNHPGQYLADGGPLGGRSGKLSRVTEMLEEALAAGDKALVFTQYREMGERLTAHFGAELGARTSFLHGGTPKAARDEMVRAFQEEPHGPNVFVLSVKAGGTGLNLTAASHVFHYDRWWNPAVEDQATDRAYRIGQKRAVQVHKLVCTGTVEERVAALLERKRKLAQIVGSGEQWLTELPTSELRELFALSQNAVVDSDEDAA